MPVQVKTIKIDDFLGIEIKDESVRAIILPELGGRIWELNDLKRNRQWIWHREDIPLTKSQLGTNYDDVWAGGWEELFPNDAPGIFEGRNLPDHGEWWTLNWNYEVKQNNEKVSVILKANTNIIKTDCIKEIALSKDTSELEIKYKIKSKENKLFHFLFKQHLALDITKNCQIWISGGSVKGVDPSFSTILPDGETYDWPRVDNLKKPIDLSIIPPISSNHKEFLYMWNLPKSCCGIIDNDKKAAIRMKYDSKKFPYLWLFLTYGGWRNLYTAVLEPCTNMPKDLSEAVRLNQSAKLDPEKEFNTKVILSLEGLVEGEDQ